MTAEPAGRQRCLLHQHQRLVAAEANCAPDRTPPPPRSASRQSTPQRPANRRSTPHAGYPQVTTAWRDRHSPSRRMDAQTMKTLPWKPAHPMRYRPRQWPPTLPINRNPARSPALRPYLRGRSAQIQPESLMAASSEATTGSNFYRRCRPANLGQPVRSARQARVPRRPAPTPTTDRWPR